MNLFVSNHNFPFFIECEPPPVIANADIYGNQRSVGSKIQYRCKTDTTKAYTSVCLNNGSWSTVHACPERIGEFNFIITEDSTTSACLNLEKCCTITPCTESFGMIT